MAEPLKNAFHAGVVLRIGEQLAAASPGFLREEFVREACDGLDALGLTERGWHVAAAMARHLPHDFARAADVLIRSLGPELRGTDGFGMAVFQYMPHVFFVAEHGVDDFEHAMRANYELTKRFSAEFSVRPFLERYPREAFAKLRLWARDPNVHVRRLVSEGSRPRLPWAPRLRSLEVDPRPGLSLLELLKDDPERYVQRSVANHLNDVAKVHADLVVSVCEDWMASPSEARRWIVERALRTLIKRGHPRALALLGARNAPGAWRVEDASVLPSRVTISGNATLSATLVNASASTRTAIVDFEIHYPGSRPGADRRKVFKLTRVTLEPRSRARLSKGISFTPRSTRAIYPGMHAVELRVNGTAFPVGRVRVARPKAPAPHTRTRRAR